MLVDITVEYDVDGGLCLSFERQREMYVACQTSSFVICCCVRCLYMSQLAMSGTPLQIVLE